MWYSVTPAYVHFSVHERDTSYCVLEQKELMKSCQSSEMYGPINAHI